MSWSGRRHPAARLLQCEDRLPVSAKQTAEANGARNQWGTTHPSGKTRLQLLIVITRFVVHVFVLSLKLFIMAEVDLEVLFTLVHDRPILRDKTQESYKDRIQTEINCSRMVAIIYPKSFEIYILYMFIPLLLIRYHLQFAVHVDLNSKIGFDSYLILEE